MKRRSEKLNYIKAVRVFYWPYFHNGHQFLTFKPRGSYAERRLKLIKWVLLIQLRSIFSLTFFWEELPFHQANGCNINEANFVLSLFFKLYLRKPRCYKSVMIMIYILRTYKV